MKLFLDDERDPPDESWTVVRSAEAFAATCCGAGAVVIAFDHDLGSDEHGRLLASGHDCLRRMIAAAQDDEAALARLRIVIFHSANPIGRGNMRALLEAAQRHGILGQVSIIEKPATSFPIST